METRPTPEAPSAPPPQGGATSGPAKPVPRWPWKGGVSSRANRVMQHHLAWPVVTLLILLAINAIFNPGFLRMEVRDSHLYGSVIDILNRAAPLVLVSLGM